MAQQLRIHPTHPQPRLVARAAEVVRAGGVIAYPTDSCYALGCRIGERAAMERIRRIRQLGNDHNFTLVCRDLSELATYAKVDNTVYRLLRAHTPGPYTFILPATREVPKRLRHHRRRTIGLRVPDAPIAQALLEQLGEPLLSSTLMLPGQDAPLTEPLDIAAQLRDELDLVIDGGHCGNVPTSVVDLSGEGVSIVRRGRGDLAAFEG